MTIFNDAEQLEKVLYNFFLQIADKHEIASKLMSNKAVLRFNYTEPDLSITIDCTKSDKPEVFVNNKNIEPEIELWMNADTAHKFWLGKVNLVMAITKKDIVVKGSVPKLLMLLPAITPAFKLYQQYLKDNDYSELI